MLSRGDPAEALDLIREAIRIVESHRQFPVCGEVYATEAWALALLGRTDEANQTLERALQRPAPEPREKGELHLQAGGALLALQRPDEARKHFQLGRDADPKGKYGRRCRDMLQRM